MTKMRRVAYCCLFPLLLAYSHLHADYGYGSERLLYQPAPIFNGAYYFKFNGSYAMALLKTKSVDSAAFPLDESWENLDTFAFGAEMGYRFNRDYEGSPLILALTYLYRPEKKFTMEATNARSGTAKLSTNQLMLSLYYDFCYDCEGSVYAGVGVGGAVHKADFIYYTNAAHTTVINNATKSQLTPAAALTLGASVPMLDLRNGSSIDLDAFARYNWLGTVNFQGANGDAIRGRPYHAFDFGLGIVIPLTFS